MKIRFLLDENLSPKLKVAVLRLNPAIDIVRVGDPDAPLLGTLDPELLCYLELSQRLLVTDNRWAESLFLLWETSDSEEWIDKLDWIPF